MKSRAAQELESLIDSLEFDVGATFFTKRAARCSLWTCGRGSRRFQDAFWFEFAEFLYLANFPETKVRWFSSDDFRVGLELNLSSSTFGVFLKTSE